MRFSASRTFLQSWLGETREEGTSFIHHPSSSAPQHQDPHSTAHMPSPSSIGRSISTPLLICSLAYLTPVCQSPSAVSTLLWNRVPREQQVSKQTPAACLQRGCSGTPGPVCRVSRGWGSVMEERALHSNLHHLVTRTCTPGYLCFCF